jgi:predicted metal-dependent HD superfamily phosphohydrolase
MNYPELNKKVQDYMLGFFHNQHDKTFIYHNLIHTQNVVKAVTQIANHYQLDEKDKFIVLTAAWFHDAGYFKVSAGHEIKGAEMAGIFLRKSGVEEDTIAMVSNCILATKIPQGPQNRLEEIVCDADLFHLGTDDFPTKNKLMRKEIEAKKGISISKDEWRKGAIQLLESHHYFTDYCRNLLDGKKKQNLEKLKLKANQNEINLKDRIIEQKEAPTVASPGATSVPQDNIRVTTAPEQTPPLPKKKKPDANRPDRGIETMFRITSGNNQRLSDMADNKAHIMITVNSIILSAIISLLLRKLDEYNFLRWPTYLILAISVLTIIFSILATRPNLPSGKFTQTDIDEKKVNLLFFGNFYKMNLSDYTAGMLQVMSDRDFLYGTLIKDVYSQGVVLGRKFRLLRISYNVFMYGLIASVLAFVIATIIAGNNIQG